MLLLSETVNKRSVSEKSTECARRSVTFHRKYRKRKDARQRETSCELQDDASVKRFFHTPKTQKALRKLNFPRG